MEGARLHGGSFRRGLQGLRGTREGSDGNATPTRAKVIIVAF